MPTQKSFSSLCLAALALLPSCSTVDSNGERAARPNIVFILADDMGFGDVHALNKDSRIPTPHLDRLAATGMTFVDAHTPSAVCTPTRYGVLTGRYCWRTRLERGVLGGYSKPLIDPDRITLPAMLRSAGYSTHAIGKWHLGMDLPVRGDETVTEGRWEGDGNVDFSERIAGGPTTRGFDTFYGVSASLDMAPYAFIEDSHFDGLPNLQQEAVGFPGFVRAGPRTPNLEFDTVLETLTQRAEGMVRERAAQGTPFFLYLALTAPHKPVSPNKKFRGKTDLGPYGDFIAEVDATVGRVLAALDAAGTRENTLVVFTSDNGSFMHRLDAADTRDHLDDESIQAFRSDRHTSNGVFRGTKADIFEAGHHVPFFVSWPGRVEARSRCQETVCLTDFFSTAAEIVGVELGADVAEDSFSFLPLLEGKVWPTPRPPVIHHSANGMFAIRDRQWKLIAGNGSGGREKPKGKPFQKPYQLFNLGSDWSETANVAVAHPGVVARLSEKLDEIREAGRSVDRRTAQDLERQ